jgi:hypothetical protein
MPANKKNLFQKLTSLFKSGPVVRRKVRTTDTAIAKADKTKSSGTLLMQKSMSPTYATITSNAYNLSERLMRCQDFAEMEYCLSGDTKITQVNGTYKTLEELAKECEVNPDHRFLVYSYDHTKGHPVLAYGKQARQTRVDDAWKVTFDDGRTITGSANHRLMLSDGTYKEIQQLVVGDSMMPIYRRSTNVRHDKLWLGEQFVYTGKSIHAFPDWEQKEKSDVNLFRQCRSLVGWNLEKFLVAKFISSPETKVVTTGILHADGDKLNNNPENLVINGRQVTTADVDSGRARGLATQKTYAEKYSHVTFAHVLQSAEKHDFVMGEVEQELHVDGEFIEAILRNHGFTISNFKAAYKKNIVVKPDVQFSEIKRSYAALTEALVYSAITESDTLQTCALKLGVSSIELAKFTSSVMKKSWQQVRQHLGFRPVQLTKRVRISKITDEDEKNLTIIKRSYFPGITKQELVKVTGLTVREVNDTFKRFGLGDNVDEFGEYRKGPVVASVEYVGVIPLYDLTVDGYKNFATDVLFSHNTPEIASALDIFSDETICANDQGRILTVHSEDEKKKEILEDLFYNVLNVEFNLRGWVRNLCKTGDMFLYNDVHPEYGVKNAFPIPVNEIEREENYDPNDPFAVRFRWVTMGNRTLENWEVTHFRLLGNDMFLPYGTSLLEAARRVWRQLILIEDAMLVYRVVRAPERRVFYIDVAGLPPENIPAYMEEQRARLRTSQVMDQSSSRVDVRYNPMPIHKDTIVPLLDGRNITIEQVAQEYEQGVENWVYSVQDGTKEAVPGKVAWCGKNYTANKLVKVWVSEDSFITTAPEHPFILSNGVKKRADELVVGDSLMSMSRDINDAGYEVLTRPNGSVIKTHIMVAQNAYKKRYDAIKYHVVHHKFDKGPPDKRNNHPERLQVMDFFDHKKLHMDHCELTLNTPEQIARSKERRIAYNKSPEKRAKTTQQNIERNSVSAMSWYNGGDLHKSHNESRSIAQKKYWEENRASRIENMSWKIPNEIMKFAFDVIKKNPKITRTDITILIRDNAELMQLLAKMNSVDITKTAKFHVCNLVQKLTTMGCIEAALYRSMRKYAAVNEAPINHQVNRIEFINEANDDVYCMTVVGRDNEQDRHNFAVVPYKNESGPLYNEFILVGNSIDEDFMIPIRGSESGTRIDTLAGGQNAAAVEDVAYIQKKLFAALKVPKAYLNYEDSLSSKATLAQIDIRFSRTISTIQKTVIAELNKLAIIHLYAHGYENEDLQDFSLHLSNPSSVAQQQKLELWRTKFEIGGTLPEGMGSKEFVQREVWGLSEQQIKDINEQRLNEKKIDMQIENALTADGGGGEGEDTDLFAGADETGGGAEEEPNKEETPPPEENASETPEEDEDDSIELIMSSDNPEDEDDYSLKVGKHDGKPAVKPVSQLKRSQYNRSRQRTHGASKTFMPDLKKMTGNDSESMRDVTGSNWMKSVVTNPFGESLQKQFTTPAPLPTDVRNMLNKMSAALNIKPIRGSGLISEATEELEVEIDDIEKMSKI